MMFGCSDYKCPANSNYNIFSYTGAAACNIDTTPPEVLDQYAGHCGFIRVNDAWTMWKYGVPYKELTCGNCKYYAAGEYSYGTCTNNEVEPETRGVIVGDKTIYAETRKCCEVSYACESFIKRGSEKVPKKQYWTKCNRKFEKNSAAETTGYEIDLNDKACADCPFQVDVKEGWPQVHKRWECRAGSLPPQRRNDWIGNLEDKNSVQIYSLDNNFLEAIKEFCSTLIGCFGANYLALDSADCRRILSISFEQNKKGITAKRTLFEKYFASYEHDTCDNCIYKAGTHCNARTGYYLDPGDQACPLFTGKQKSEAQDPDKPVTEAPKDNTWHPKCPYLMSIGLFTINCGHYARPIADKGFQSEGERREHSDIYCFGNFDWCETYQKAYEAEIKSTDKNIKEYRECAYCCNNSGYTGLSDSVRGTKYGFCQVHQEEREKFNPDTVCEWYNRLKRKDEEQVISEDEKCKSKNKACGYYCEHNNGCALLLMHGVALNSAVEDIGQVDCDIWRKTSGQKVKQPEMCDSCDNEIDGGCVPPASGDNCIGFETKLPEAASSTIQPFDYSTVDSDTAEFLQEKANNIIKVKMMAMISVAKELKEAQDKLANHNQGTFIAWCESIGYPKSTVYDYLRAYEWVVRNSDNGLDFSKIQPSLLLAVSKPSAPAELQEGVKSGDITSHKQYKELEKRLKEAEERAERAVKQKFVSDGKTIDAENKAKKAIQEKTDALKAYERDLNNLHQQLEQAKRNSDPAKVQELGERIAEYQSDISTYQQQIGNLNIQLAEKERQLKAKPIEVPATQVREIIPDEIALAIYHKIESLCESVVELTEEEIQIFAQNVDPDTVDDINEKFLSASRIFEQIGGAVNENQSEEEPEEEEEEEPDGHCGDCVHADMDNITPEQVENATPLCTITNTIVDFDHTCSRYKKHGGRP